MKIILLILLCLSLNTTSTAYAAQENHFAQITQSGVYLYKNTTGEKLFELPESYFVSVISERDDYYAVVYNNIHGYVRRTDIRFISEVPKTPYLTSSTFRVFSSEGCYIYKLPSSRSSRLTRVDLYSSLPYIGVIEGEELVPGRGNEWYYTMTTTSSGEIIYGYIYSGLCDNFSSYTLNTEKVTYIEKVSMQSTEERQEGQSSFFAILIGVLTLSALILYLLYLPFAITKRTRRKYATYEHTKPSIFFDDLEI